MSNKKRAIAQKFAPVLCCELSKDREKCIFDCFSSIKFTNADPWNMEDRIKAFKELFPENYEELEIIESSLIPSIYYSLLETDTHYFLLYTVYHALDQKSPFGHEHDMEHIQVVVRKSKREEEDVVEYVSTNAHHAYFYYVNENNPITPHPPYITDSNHGNIVLYEKTHPIVYIQPGDGSIISVFNEEIGHGIFGIGGVYKGGFRFDWSHKWDAKNGTFDFENKEGGKPIGIVAMNADDNNPAESYRLKINDVNRIYYELESVEETIWKWFKERKNNNSLCKKKCQMPKRREDWYRRTIKDPNLLRRMLKSIKDKPWKPCLFKEKKDWEPWNFKISGENLKRKKYFKQKLHLKKITYPSGVCGTKDKNTGYVRIAGGAWPFEYKNRVTGKRFSKMTGKWSWKYAPVKTLDIFFDPAAAYKIMVIAKEPISTEYIDYPYA